MDILYKKPAVRSYSTGDVLEVLGPCQNQYTTTLNPSVDDTIIYSDGSYSFNSVLYPTSPPRVGDDAGNGYFRGFFSFDISSIHSTIVSATLKLYQISSVGAPYTDLGNFILDHANFGTLEANATDFDNYLTLAIASTSDSSNSWKEFDVKTAVQTDIDAGRTTSQFKVRFSTNTNSDDGNDFIGIEDIENHNSTGNKAQLVVTYQ